MLINAPTSNLFSVLPEELAELSRQKHQQRQVLKVLLFTWQAVTLALPEVAAQRVIPLPTEHPETLINQGHFDWQGMPVKVLLSPLEQDIWANTTQPETSQPETPRFVLIFKVPDGPLLGLPLATIPDSVSIPLNCFTAIARETRSEIPHPFRNWVKFQAQPHPEEPLELHLPEILYLFDMELLQSFG